MDVCAEDKTRSFDKNGVVFSGFCQLDQPAFQFFFFLVAEIETDWLLMLEEAYYNLKDLYIFRK